LEVAVQTPLSRPMCEDLLVAWSTAVHVLRDQVLLDPDFADLSWDRVRRAFDGERQRARVIPRYSILRGLLDSGVQPPNDSLVHIGDCMRWLRNHATAQREP
jgi:hypothetical protein